MDDTRNGDGNRGTDGAGTHEEKARREEKGHEEKGHEEKGEPQIVQLTTDQLDELISRAAATAVEAAFEQERMAGRHVPEPDSVRYVPRQGPPRRQGGLQHYDPDSDESFDPFVRAVMWRPDRIDSCHCGAVQYARTMTKVGERDIRDAQRPIVDPSSGVVLTQPHRFVVDPQTGDPILPAALMLDDEKRAHLVACKKAHYDRMGVAGQVAEKVANPASQPTSDFDPRAGQELAAQAHYAAAGHDVG